MFTSFGVSPAALGAGLPVYFKRQVFAGMHEAIKAEVAGFLTKAQLVCRASRATASGASVVVRSVGSLQYKQEEIVSLEDLATEEITLVKPDGSKHKTTASVQKNTMIVFDTRFPVAAGDKISHTLPSGLAQWFEVIEPGFVAGPGGMEELSHYEIKVRNMASPRRDPPPPVVTHNYHNAGIANVMGPDGVASGNTNSMQIMQQTLNLGDPRIESELSELRRVLRADEDEDAAIEAGHVATAQKALKAGDEGGFRAAMMRLGNKTWDLAQRLALPSREMAIHSS